MKILGIDVGRKTGWAFLDSYGFETGKLSYGKSLLEYKKAIKDLILRYEPDLVVSALPTRFYNSIVLQTTLITIIKICCEELDKQFYPVYDKECKKNLFKNGNSNKKVVQEWAQKETKSTISEDEADAMMFCAHINDIVQQK